MKRYVESYLQNWLADPRRKPLVMRGARQVGKTWLVRHLAKTMHKKLIEINFEQNPELVSAFNTNDPLKILQAIELSMDLNINIDQSILFLDEIQTFPQILAKLRWFYESLPALPVIVAGSLLDFALEEHEFSMPVGRISYVHIEPLSFEEFLLAKGLVKIVSFLNEFHMQDEVSSTIHQKLINLFAEYLIVGGMPYSVATWIETGSLTKVSIAHSELLLTYRDDFSKYAGKISTHHLESVMSAVPNSLGQKFVFRHANRDTKIATLKKALDLLCKARLCYKINATAANGLPLMAEIDDKRFKVGFVDVGLISTFLGLRLDQLESASDINLINNGALSEQVTGQLLRCIDPPFLESRNFYWCREEKSANAEIDFLLQHENKIVPIEVKSGTTGSLKSLHYFMHLKRKELAVRINSDLPSITSVAVMNHQKQPVQYRLLSLPFYLIQQVHRLLKASIDE